MACAALKLFGQHLRPPAARNVGKAISTPVSAGSRARPLGRGDVRRFEMRIGDGDSFEALIDERDQDVADGAVAVSARIETLPVNPSLKSVTL